MNDDENINNNLEVHQFDKKIKDKNENSKEEKKKKKHIISDSLLDIDLEEKKVKKHKSKKKKLSRTSNSINSYNSGSKNEIENNLKEESNDNIISFDKNKNDDKENEEKENEEKENEKKENEENQKNDLKIRSENIPKKEKGFDNKNSFENNKNNEIENNKRENKKIKNDEKKIQNEELKEISKKEQSIFQKIKKEFPMSDGFNINTDYIKDKEDKDIKEEEENPGVPKKIQAPPQVLALMKKQGKANLTLPTNNSRISFREFGKGNLEIVEPGELVSSERLKMVKKNLKRNLTCNSDKFPHLISSVNSGPLSQSSYFKNDIFNLNSKSNPKKQEEINKKIVPILEKKDEGLFDKKKYFKKWGTKSSTNLKPHDINLFIRPQVKKASNIPVIFLTKSLEDNNDAKFIKDGRKNNNENDLISGNNKNNENKNMNIRNEEKKNIVSNNIKENNNEKEKIENNSRIKRNEINRNNRNDINNIRIINNNQNNSIKRDNISLPVDKMIERKSKNEKLSLDKIKKDGEEEEEEEENEEENKEEGRKEIKDKNREIIKNKKENPAIKENREVIYDKEMRKNKNNNKTFNYMNDIQKEEKKEIDPKERANKIKNMYKLIKEINKGNNNIFTIIEQSHNFNVIENDYINFLDNQNKKIKAYQLYLFYLLFNDDYKYFLKRNAFYKWKKGNKIFNDVLNKNHIKLYNQHCISCSCDDVNYLEGQTTCLNCNCDEIKNTLKNILINYKFMKELNPIRYYFYLWYKNIFF